jgi:broad specificity phosphatase PhoE
VRLTLVRHGQSVANAAGRLQGQMDFPLSTQGINEAKAVGKWLADEEVDAIYSSDLSRALQTAQEIAQHHTTEIIKNPALREFHLGEFQGLTREEIRERFPEYVDLDWWTAGVAGVEQIDQIKARALEAVQLLLERHQGQRVVVVSHGGWIGTLLMALLNIEWKGKRVFTIGNTSMTTIDFSDPKQMVVVGVNETPHLIDQMKQKKKHQSA